MKKNEFEYERKLIERTGLFDEKWYASEYLQGLTINPIDHFISIGWAENNQIAKNQKNLLSLSYSNKLKNRLYDVQEEAFKQNPKLFNEEWYLKYFPQLKQTNINLFEHYLNNELFKEIMPEGEFIIIFKNIVEKARKEFFTHAFSNIFIKKENSEKNKGVIYTCLTGDYDNLLTHYCQNKNWDYICFSDNIEMIKAKKIAHWEIRPLQFNKLDRVKNARWHKTHPHILLPEYDYSLWIDANINVIGKGLFDKISPLIQNNSLLATLKHPERNCVYQEIEECIRIKKDDPNIINTMKNFLEHVNFAKNRGLHETSIIFRQHNVKAVSDVMELWFDMIRNYSRRDQLSFDFVILEQKIHTLHVDTFYNGTQRIDNGELIFCNHLYEYKV